jgi:hypothetical protein
LNCTQTASQSSRDLSATVAHAAITPCCRLGREIVGINRLPVEILADIVKRVRDQMGAVVAFKTALVVALLPTTRSCKIPGGTIVKMLTAEPYAMLATIEDPAVLGEIEQDLQAAGLVAADAAG